jgi:hypothetical protein
MSRRQVRFVQWDEQDAITKSDETPKLRQVQVLQDYEEVLVTGAALGSDELPEQAQIDFHKAELGRQG